MNAADKTALVTGAGARIGAAIATLLHQRGCRVLVHYNSNRAGADALVEHLNSIRGQSARSVCGDLSLPRDVERLIHECGEYSGQLDVLVNNASRFYSTVVGETLPWQWDDLINSNMRGPYFLTQGLVPMLRAAKGAIVNILDVHAERPMSGHAAYCISKAGLGMMTLALARDLGPDIRVNGVSPGAILWPEHVHGQLTHPDQEAEDSAQAAILKRTVLGHRGEPEDIASAVAYLALDAPYVTGQILAVDGGRLLSV